VFQLEWYTCSSPSSWVIQDRENAGCSVCADNAGQNRGLHPSEGRFPGSLPLLRPGQALCRLAAKQARLSLIAHFAPFLGNDLRSGTATHTTGKQEK
jgi:hypothetical protein